MQNIAVKKEIKKYSDIFTEILNFDVHCKCLHLYYVLMLNYVDPSLGFQGKWYVEDPTGAVQVDLSDAVSFFLLLIKFGLSVFNILCIPNFGWLRLAEFNKVCIVQEL